MNHRHRAKRSTADDNVANLEGTRICYHDGCPHKRQPQPLREFVSLRYKGGQYAKLPKKLTSWCRTCRLEVSARKRAAKEGSKGKQGGDRTGKVPKFKPGVPVSYPLPPAYYAWLQGLKDKAKEVTAQRGPVIIT